MDFRGFSEEILNVNHKETNTQIVKDDVRTTDREDKSVIWKREEEVIETEILGETDVKLKDLRRNNSISLVRVDNVLMAKNLIDTFSV